MSSVKKRFLEVCSAVAVFLGMFTVTAGINAYAETVNGWEVYGNNVSLTAESSTETRIAYAAGYNWSNSHAYLKNALFAPESGAGVVSFKFKANELADGDWIPFGICWAKDSESTGSLNVNGLKMNVTNSGGNGFVQFYENHPTKLTEDVAISLTEYNTLTLICGPEGSNQVDVLVNGAKAFTYTNGGFYGMVAGANPTASMSLVVGGGENTAITVDTNASGWSAEGDQSKATIVGTPDYVGITITGGNHESIYAKTVDNAFKNQRTGLWGFDLKVSSFEANWAVLTLNWSLSGTPATSNSGLCFQLTPDGEGKYQIDPKFLESVAMASAPASFSIAEFVRITIECTSTGDVTVKANGTTIGTAAGGANVNYLYNEYPYAGFPGLTLSTGGDGAYSLLIKRFSAPADKTVLNAKIAECETDKNGTIVGDSIGQVSQEAMNMFEAAINTAKAVAEDEFATQAAVDSAVIALDEALTAFKNVKIKTGDTTALQASIVAAQKLMERLTEGSEKHTQLQTKLNEAVSVYNNPNASQQELDAQKNDLDALVDQITASTKFWTVSPEENEGIAVTVDGDRTTISNSKDIHRSTNPINIYSNIEKKDGRVIFNVNVKKRKDFNDGIWQLITISSRNEVDTAPLSRTGVQIGFGGTFGKSELNISHAGTKTQIGTYSFRENYEMQFSVGIETRDGTEILVIRIDGLEFVSIADAEIIDVLKGDLIIGYTGAGNEAEGRDDYLSIIEIDLNPAVIKPDKAFGEFIAAGPSGVGKTNGASVASDGDVQTITFLMDDGAFVNACARTNIKGPVTSFEYSVKINALIPGDWHALEFSNDFAHTGINSKGIAMSFAGSDNTVKFAEFYGDNGMGSPAGWEALAEIKQGKKMRIKIALEDDQVVCYLNDKEVARKPASEKVKELFNSDIITVALFGSASSDTEFEIGYLNKEDPVPPDSLEEEPVYESTDIISLDDSQITVSGKEITILKDMTIEEFISLIYVEGDYSFAFYDKNGQEITDASQGILKATCLVLFAGAEEMDSYIIQNGTGSAPIDPVDTGENLLVHVYIVTVLSCVALLLIFQKYRSVRVGIR